MSDVASDGHWYGHDIMGDPPLTAEQIAETIISCYQLWRDDLKNPNISTDSIQLEVEEYNFACELKEFHNLFDGDELAQTELRKHLQMYIKNTNPDYLFIDQDDIREIQNYFQTNISI